MTYSVTLNFFVPKEIVAALKDIKISGTLIYDWRDSYCHVTVKALLKTEEFPNKEILDEFVLKSQKLLDTQKPFNTTLQNIAQFPNALFAEVISEELVTLHKKLCEVLPSSQPEFENEKYTPHASIGTLAEPVNIISEKQDFGEFKVHEIQLMIWKWNNKQLQDATVYHRFLLK